MVRLELTNVLDILRVSINKPVEWLQASVPYFNHIIAEVVVVSNSFDATTNQEVLKVELEMNSLFFVALELFQNKTEEKTAGLSELILFYCEMPSFIKSYESYNLYNPSVAEPVWRKQVGRMILRIEGILSKLK